MTRAQQFRHQSPVQTHRRHTKAKVFPAHRTSQGVKVHDGETLPAGSLARGPLCP